MKKQIFTLMMALLALGFAGCKEKEEPQPDPKPDNMTATISQITNDVQAFMAFNSVNTEGFNDLLGMALRAPKNAPATDGESAPAMPKISVLTEEGFALSIEIDFGEGMLYNGQTYAGKMKARTQEMMPLTVDNTIEVVFNGLLAGTHELTGSTYIVPKQTGDTVVFDVTSSGTAVLKGQQQTASVAYQEHSIRTTTGEFTPDNLTSKVFSITFDFIRTSYKGEECVWTTATTPVVCQLGKYPSAGDLRCNLPESLCFTMGGMPVVGDITVKSVIVTFKGGDQPDAKVEAEYDFAGQHHVFTLISSCFDMMK